MRFQWVSLLPRVDGFAQMLSILRWSNAQHMPHIAPADRPSIQLENDVLDPRAQWAKTHGMSERTAARKLRAHTRYVAGVAYVFREASKREFAGLNQHQRPRKRNHATA